MALPRTLRTIRLISSSHQLPLAQASISHTAMSIPLPPSDRPRKHPRRNGPRPPKKPLSSAANHGQNDRAPSAQMKRASQPQISTASTPAASTPGVEVGQTRFADIPGLSPDLLQAIPYEYCTEVQAETLPVILANHDVLAQAKTGTGKTLAFLIPSIQRLIHGKPPARGQISILIISPTRELAQQISKEAEGVLNKLAGKVGGRKYGVLTVVGGTNVKTDMKRLENGNVDLLVGTPGRLIDLLDNSPLKGQLSRLNSFILDEADRLLDQGFRRELAKIIQSLPDPRSVPRQTLLFSATIPDSVMGIAKDALKPDHKFISTIKEDDVNVHQHVKQELIVVEQAQLLPATLGAIEREAIKNPSYKVMVFLPTARAAALFHDVFTQVGAFQSWEIHSRMSQSARTKTTEAFRVAKRGVLFSSDVTARGIDIKDVTAVIQAGVPANAEQYIHRLGRTARAGAEGHGVLILTPPETFFLKDKVIRDLTLHSIPAGTPDEVAQWHSQVDKAMDRVDQESKAQAYRAWLGYYKALLKAMGWTSAQLVQEANKYSSDTLRYGKVPPGIERKTIGKMGLKGVSGLNITSGN